ncbi:MAG: hypothetical protein KDA93_14250 [Planctomycetaceae bacterium]|nr:hypothetical protein [Planctomycetaceae bacterium]
MFPRFALLILLSFLCVGCGTTSTRTATEQLLASSAVDSAISQIDFGPLAGQTVYLETEYLKDYKDKGIGFVNAEYIISSLRQQIVASGCLLQETKEEADFILEGRVGVLGTDSHDIIYGLPANNVLNAAASLAPNVPSVPTIPEISLAKKKDELSAAKVAVFAYHRESKQRVWQSGISLARSTAKDTWFLGAGPFQSGTVYNGVKFAGTKIELSPGEQKDPVKDHLSEFRESNLYHPASYFDKPPTQVAEESGEAAGDVVPASAEVEVDAEAEGE